MYGYLRGLAIFIKIKVELLRSRDEVRPRRWRLPARLLPRATINITLTVEHRVNIFMDQGHDQLYTSTSTLQYCTHLYRMYIQLRQLETRPSANKVHLVRAATRSLRSQTQHVPVSVYHLACLPPPRAPRNRDRTSPRVSAAAP